MEDYMRIENLDEYLLQVQNYQEGNYEFGTISSPMDIKNAIKRGKKVVFIKSKARLKMMVLVVSMIFIVGLIVAIITSIFVEYWIIHFGICMAITGGLALIFLIQGLLKVGKSFIVLGPEGIVYKLPRAAIQGFSWEDIYMDVFRGQSTLKFYERSPYMINIWMPNNNILKIFPEDYISKDFPKPKTFNSPYFQSLFISTFKGYYDFGKRGRLETRKLEENERRITTNVTTTRSLVRGDYLDILEEEYKEYKKKNYNFGKYGTIAQIRNEFRKGKTFVLKGGLRFTDWVFIIFFFGLGLFMLILVAVISVEFIEFGIFFIVLFTFLASMFLIKLRNLIVIGPSGVYYQKILSKGSFLWHNVASIKGYNLKYIYSGRENTIVKLYLRNGERKKFLLRVYLMKEFPKAVEREMFINLFKVYYELGKNSNI